MIKQEIKGNLARLLATENLVVEHRRVPTASFDVDRRVLTLPNWDRASSIVYDMLVGHEVGHALFTPNEDWSNFFDCPKDFVNVIEDARIEKLMKRKYPGLRKSFAGGYQELNDQDFFGIAEEDTSKLSLIDRINLHFKIGAAAMIPFSIEEQVFVSRTDVAETFEEVCQIAVDVYEFSKQEKVEELPSVDNQQQDEENEESETESNDAEQSVQQNTSDSVGNTTPQSTDSWDDDEEEEGDEYDAGETSKTQENFDNAAKQFTDMYSSNPVYIEIPESVELEEYIADWTEVHNWIDQHKYSPEYYENVDNQYYEFRKQSQKEVNYLVKEFECRKSADAYARAGQSKTGVLDTAKLHTYKYNDDIFKKVTMLPDGKNHGLLFILDWSGSMANELMATVKQLLNLTAFCKKVQIPFEVYAFTNEYYAVRRALSGKDEYMSNEEFYSLRDVKEGEVFLGKGMFHMMNFISSRSNAREYERMCKNLFREAYSYRYYVEYRSTPGIGLSGTPLNEAVIMMNYIVPQFKKNNDIQKVNVCILSDGESCQAAYGRKFYNDHRDEYYVRPRRIEYNVCLRDRKTGRVYTNLSEWGRSTNVFIQQLRDRNPSVNVLGFRILPGSQLTSFVSNYGDSAQYDKVQKQWKKEKSAIILNPQAYSALYAISSKSIESETSFDVESGAKKGEISRAFKKMLGSKSTNKKLLSSFIEYVA